MKLKVYEAGDKENQSIIFIHGFPLSHKMWDSVINGLKNEFYCVSYDIRGLGSNYNGDGLFTFEDLSDDVFEIIREFKLNSPVICGLSMGGYITYRCLERNQKLFKSAIICGAKPNADGNEGKLKRAAFIKIINNRGLSSFTNMFIPSTFSEKFASEYQEKLSSIIQESSDYNAGGVKGCCLAMACRTDTSPFLDKIEIPILFLSGEFDTLTTPAQLKSVADKVKNSDFKIIQDAGHIFPVESPAVSIEIISKFVKKI